VKALELSPGSRYQSARAFRDDLAIALRRLTGAPAAALVAEAVPAIAVVMCPHCGNQTRADLPRCQHCGVPLRTSGSGANGAKRSVVRPLESGKVAAVPPPKATPLQAPPSTGKQQARPAGTGKQPVAPFSSGKQPVVPAASGKQSVIVPPAGGRGASPVAEPERRQQIAVEERTGTQFAAVGGRSRASAAPAPDQAVKRATAGPASSTVAGALALAPDRAAPVSARERREAAAAGRAAQAAARAAAAAQTRPRSWLNLGGPELSSLGKSALALSAVEICWGVILLALAIVEVVARDSADKPYLLLAAIWFGVVIFASLIGAQIFGRPIHRRGRVKRRQRAFRGFGLAVYALAVHGIAIWGVVVFSTSRPNPPLAIVAFVLFAVNVFVAGVLSLVNTLG
jgi:hypothetical protein